MASKKKLNGTHIYAEFKQETVQARVKKMLDLRYQVDVPSAHVKFSYGNRKTTALVPSVSLIPVADCCNCAACSRGCYDIRHVCCYNESQKQRANNSAIYAKDPQKYFEEIEHAVKYLRFFRWHIGGDIRDFTYFPNVVRIAQNTPTCEFLIFTKNWAVVNTWLDLHELPKNLHVILSGWRGDVDVNEHKLPVSSPVWKDGSMSCMATENRIWCPGDCSQCAETNAGCWGAKNGDTILFNAH